MSEKILKNSKRVSYQDVKDLYEGEHKRLVLFGCKLSEGDMDLAEDLVSSMYQKLIQRRPIILGCSLRCYAFRVIRNNFLDHLKGKGNGNHYKRVSLSYSDDNTIEKLDELSINPSEVMFDERDEMRIRIRALVNEMPPGDREAFTLCILQGMTYSEAVKVSGRTRGALKMSVSRAYRSLAKSLSKSGINLEERVRVDRT